MAADIVFILVYGFSYVASILMHDCTEQDHVGGIIEKLVLLRLNKDWELIAWIEQIPLALIMCSCIK